MSGPNKTSDSSQQYHSYSLKQLEKAANKVVNEIQNLQQQKTQWEELNDSIQERTQHLQVIRDVRKLLQEIDGSSQLSIEQLTTSFKGTKDIEILSNLGTMYSDYKLEDINNEAKKTINDIQRLQDQKTQWEEPINKIAIIDQNLAAQVNELKTIREATNIKESAGDNLNALREVSSNSRNTSGLNKATNKGQKYSSYSLEQLQKAANKVVNEIQNLQQQKTQWEELNDSIQERTEHLQAIRSIGKLLQEIDGSSQLSIEQLKFNFKGNKNIAILNNLEAKYNDYKLEDIHNEAKKTIHEIQRLQDQKTQWEEPINKIAIIDHNLDIQAKELNNIREATKTKEPTGKEKQNARKR